MQNHFHFLVQIKYSEKLPIEFDSKVNKLHQPFSNLFNAYTKAINKSYNRTGSLFQERFHKLRITDEKYLKNLIPYIHLNPIKHELSDNFKTYRYSSYMAIITNKPTNIKRDKVIELFDDLDNFIFWHDFKKIRFDGLMKQIDEIDD